MKVHKNLVEKLIVTEEPATNSQVENDFNMGTLSNSSRSLRQSSLARSNDSRNDLSDASAGADVTIDSPRHGSSLQLPTGYSGLSGSSNIHDIHDASNVQSITNTPNIQNISANVPNSPKSNKTLYSHAPFHTANKFDTQQNLSLAPAGLDAVHTGRESPAARDEAIDIIAPDSDDDIGPDALRRDTSLPGQGSSNNILLDMADLAIDENEASVSADKDHHPNSRSDTSNNDFNIDLHQSGLNSNSSSSSDSSNKTKTHSKFSITGKNKNKHDKDANKAPLLLEDEEAGRGVMMVNNKKQNLDRVDGADTQIEFAPDATGAATRAPVGKSEKRSARRTRRHQQHRLLRHSPLDSDSEEYGSRSHGSQGSSTRDDDDSDDRNESKRDVLFEMVPTSHGHAGHARDAEEHNDKQNNENCDESEAPRVGGDMEVVFEEGADEWLDAGQNMNDFDPMTMFGPGSDWSDWMHAKEFAGVGDDGNGEIPGLWTRFLKKCCVCYNDGSIIGEFAGKNAICCNGHVYAGVPSQYCTLSFTFVLILAPLAGWYWVQYEYFWEVRRMLFSLILVLLVSAPLTFFSLYFLLRTNLTDPGVVPRCSKNAPMIGPLNEKDRFCNTCYVIRPARAKHCTICNNCVFEFDHHCPWVGQCVAARNLRYFVGFVTTTGTQAFTCATTSLIIIFLPNFEIASGVGLMNVLLLIYCSIISCMLLGMSGDYFMMVGNRVTLNEKIKYGHRIMTKAEQERESAFLQNQNVSESSRFQRNLIMGFCGESEPSAIFK